MKKNEFKQSYLTIGENAELKLKRIVFLYKQLLNTDENDADYRAKLVYELLQFGKEDGSFSVIDDYHCDSDIRVAYVYFPTYYATASLMFVMNMDGRNKNIEESLKKGLIYPVRRHMMGHGFDATAQQLKAMKIYKEAGLYEWIRKYGKDYSDFSDMIHDVVECYRHNLMTGNVKSDWDVDFSEQFEQEVNDYDNTLVTNIWYAAYGSNINYARFMEYISKCTDKTPPLQSKAILIPHNIYFAYKSGRWNGKGVAFLDDTCEGHSFGRMYLINSEQFAEIQKMEGSIYRKKIMLGTEDGLPIYTFTAPEKRNDLESPDLSYMETILEGLKETYSNVSELALAVYLFKHGMLLEDDIKVLRFIRSSEHGVSLKEISDNTFAITRVKNVIKKLVYFKLIKQDGRSVSAGYNLLSQEAIVYTCKNMRELIDLINVIC